MPAASSPQTIRLSCGLQDREPDPYRLLPFDVPQGTARLCVRYQFWAADDPDRVGKASGSVIDLGLFDPRGHGFLEAQGFRGWSGGARSEVVLTPTEATPGYLPGPLYAGTWHVLLGLYRIAPQGCEVMVTIDLTPGGEAEAAVPARTPSYSALGAVRDGAGWYRGDLHSHTYHSDGSAGVATLAEVARVRGLDFVAVTDHNTVSHLPELSRHSGPDLLLIPGVEVTTYRGHANVWGVRTWQEFRVTTEDEMRRVRDRARDQGLVFSINHPKEGGPDWEFGSTFEADAIEAWQAPWWLSNYASLSFWDRLLRQGSRPTLVGGSDKHQRPFDGTLSGFEVGTPTTWVYADALSEDKILAGIRRGHAFVSQGPTGPRLEWTARAGDRSAMMGDELSARRGETVTLRCRVIGAQPGWLLRVVHKEGEAHRAPIEAGDVVHTWQVAVGEPDYWRVEVIEHSRAPLDVEPGALIAFALSNPIYVRPR